MDYDEFVNDFYLFLMENDAYRLRQFQGRSSVYQWMKVVAIRHFSALRKRNAKIIPDNEIVNSDTHDKDVNDEKVINARLDIENFFAVMTNRRYVYVIRRLILQDTDPDVVADELNNNVENLDNIKKRP